MCGSQLAVSGSQHADKQHGLDSLRTLGSMIHADGLIKEQLEPPQFEKGSHNLHKENTV